MDENEITQRLRDAGRQQVPGDVRSTHLTRMHAAVPTVEQPKRFGRLAVAAAAVVGFTVGSTGFAMAGALPDPAQQVAHDVLSVVQVDVENPRNRGQCVSAIARDPNRTPEEKEAAKAECPQGKPDHAGEGRPDHAGEGNGRPDHAGVPGGPNGRPHAEDDCKGPPPWAGKGARDVTPEEKRAFQETRAACPDDDGDDALEDEQERRAEALEDQRDAEADALEEQQEREAEQREAEQREAQAEAPEVQQPPVEGPATQGPPEGTPAPPAPAGPPADVPAAGNPNDTTDPEAG
jgi:hypothetical protein